MAARMSENSYSSADTNSSEACRQFDQSFPIFSAKLKQCIVLQMKSAMSGFRSLAVIPSTLSPDKT